MNTNATGKTAYVFSGQGSQGVGMGKALYDAYPRYRDVLDQSDALSGQPLTTWMFTDAARLNQTQNVQPMIFAMQAGILALLDAADLKVEGACGLSLGEYAALYQRGVFNFETAFRSLIHRGYFMEQTTQQDLTVMAALIGPVDGVMGLLKAFPNWFAANYNLPNQTVVGGPVGTLEALLEAAPQHGFKRAIKLETAGAFHTPHMQSAADAFGDYLRPEIWEKPCADLYLNTTGRQNEADADLKALMVRQIVEPTHFHTMIEAMKANGYRRFVEIGPGKALSNMIKKIDRSFTVLSVETPEELEQAISILRSDS